MLPFPVIHPDEPPCVDVHYEWGQDALWLSGRYGYHVLDGRKIGLSRSLVLDLIEWRDAADSLVDPNDYAGSPVPDNFDEDCFALAKRVRAELPEEWVVTAWHPIEGRTVVLPLRE